MASISYTGMTDLNNRSPNKNTWFDQFFVFKMATNLVLEFGDYLRN